MTLRRAVPILAMVAIGFVPGQGWAQLPSSRPQDPAAQGTAAPPPPILTMFTLPADADVHLKGPMDLAGRTPLDLPATITGRYQIVTTGAGFARTHGVIFLPPRGGLPFVLSEPRSGSMGLFLRGLNYPGVPDLTSGRGARGMALVATATGGLFGAFRAHLSYRDRLDEVGDFAADRGADERRQRNAWLIYSGAVWGMSAVDYWIRPRIDLAETTPTRLTLDVPRLSRLGAAWRSILVPGAGQEFGNHRTRSIVWLGTVLLAGAAYVVADYRVTRDETDVKWAALAVDSAGPSTIQARLLELEQEQRDLDVSRDVRRGIAIAGLSLHALNIIDAMIMPLALPAPTRPKVAQIEPLLDPEAPGLAVRVSF